MDINENLRKTMALIAMVIIGALVLVAAGLIAMYFIPPEALYNQLITKIFFLAAATFLLLLGIDKIHLNSVRNLVAFFVLLIAGVVIVWRLDLIAAGSLWGGAYPSVYGRIPEHDVNLFLQALDILAILAAAIGAFLLLLKCLDLVKDLLNSAGSKSVTTKPKENVEQE